MSDPIQTTESASEEPLSGSQQRAVYAAEEKPPLGVYPRWLAEEKRYSDILDAIVRYRKGQYIIPPEWLEEAGEIARRIQERKRHTE
jgi:hypothetical protein